MIKIALLLLDDFISPEGDDFADLGKKLIESSYVNNIHNHNLEFTKFKYVENLNNLPTNPESYDLIYLTGSRKDSYEDNQFNNTLINYLQKVITNPSTKILGICFGHQIIARALGLDTKPNEKGWEMGNTLIDIDSEDYLKLNNSTIPHNFVISEMHRDIVVINDENDMNKLVKLGIHSFGKTKICDLQGFYKHGHLLTFQGHPEFTCGLTSGMITTRFEKGIITQDFYLDACKRNQELREDGSDPDGELKLQKWIAEFIFEQ